MSRKDRDDIVSTEAVRERKAVRQPRSGETSTGNDAAKLIAEEGEKVSIVIHKMNASISSSSTTTAELEKKFKSLEEALKKAEADDEHNAKPKIEKIPFMLRRNENFKKYLNPRVVSVGPCHAMDPDLPETKSMKLKLAALFIKEGGMDRNLLYETILVKIADFKGCYTDEATKGYNNEELAWMFLVDGCAILQYMIICGTEKKEDRNSKFKKLKIKKDHMSFIQQDVFLLGNQLPYDLLELLMRLSIKHNELQISIEKFILNSIRAPTELYNANKRNYQQMQEKKPLHLLDLLRKTLIIQPDEQDTGSCRGILRKILKQLNLAVENLRCKKEHELHSFRNIEELKAAGIRLKPSKTSNMKSISFSWGTLKIPPIIIDDSTAAKLLNMVAYEMCPDFNNEFEVSTYIFFMDSLIDRPQDVKELRESGILHNALGSDKEVAELFNKISTDLVIVPEMYSDVQQRIQKHYDNIWINWIAQFIGQHFQSPWSVLAFTAAILALGSSIVQTIYTIKAYYKPA